MNLVKNKNITFKFNLFRGLDNVVNNFVFQPEIEFNEIYKIHHSNNKLKIELRTEKHHFDILQKLCKL